MTTETEHNGCDHDFSKHLVIAGEDPLQGGIMRCPEKGCSCHSTWGVNGKHPHPDLVAELTSAFEAGVLDV